MSKETANSETIVHESPESTSDAAAVRLLDSTELFQGLREVFIQHGAARYRMRITRSGKLILQK